MSVYKKFLADILKRKIVSFIKDKIFFINIPLSELENAKIEIKNTKEHGILFMLSCINEKVKINLFGFFDGRKIYYDFYTFKYLYSDVTNIRDIASTILFETEN